MKKLRVMIIIFLMLILYSYVANVTLIPKEITLLKGESYKVRKMYGIEVLETASTSNNSINNRNMEISLLGINLKDININVIEDLKVVPVGKIIGLKLYTNGVLVVGMSEIEDINSNTIINATDLKRFIIFLLIISPINFMK